MQEEVTRKTIALAIKTAKLDGKVLQAALRKLLQLYPLKTFLISQRKGKGLSGRRKGAFLMDQHPRCGAVLQLADKEQTADCRRNVDRP